MGRPIITENGCVPGAADFQAGTLNIGDTEISDTAGFSMSACGWGTSREPGAERWAAHAHLHWPSVWAGAWLNVSNRRTFSSIIKENKQWIYQTVSPIHQQQAIWILTEHMGGGAHNLNINHNLILMFVVFSPKCCWCCSSNVSTELQRLVTKCHITFSLFELNPL